MFQENYAKQIDLPYRRFYGIQPGSSRQRKIQVTCAAMGRILRPDLYETKKQLSEIRWSVAVWTNVKYAVTILSELDLNNDDQIEHLSNEGKSHRNDRSRRIKCIAG